MIDWRDITAKTPPMPGMYLTCTPNPARSEPWVDCAEWYAKGATIYLDNPERGEAAMLRQIINGEYTFAVPRAGFWYTDGESAWELRRITHWASVPNLPDGYERPEDMP